MNKFYIKRFFRIRSEFILLEYDKPAETDPKIGILYLEKSKDDMIKIINLTRSEMKGVLPALERYNEYFYYHENHYLLTVNDQNTLCLCSLNAQDQLLRLVCNLSKYTKLDNKCSFVVNPHLKSVIYVNLKKNNKKTRTYVSFDNGKNFLQIKFTGKRSECTKNKCGVELYLECSSDFIKNHFPGKWIVTFHGKLHKNGLVSRHIFISFDGGERWKLLDSKLDKLYILNGGGLILGRERKTHRIWNSYNEGINWYKNNVSTRGLIGIKPLDFSKNRMIAGISYDEYERVYSLFLFEFAHIISSFGLIIDRTCQSDDFETWYIPRYFGNCFQGHEVYYWRKKLSSICFDNRTEVLPIIKSCPCSLEDFHWYINIIHSKYNYHFIDNLCVKDPLSNFTESKKMCRYSGIPLIRWNGYDVIKQ
ncbi:Vacuolar protein sorting/targeting protein 10 [Thelohanellus kitauei]|uniref:Vacuolar protein sorting/targeting protein 10 n=1 Tax=Thelohanellus kitauei TaxID=669202 RepID=A0A0C2J4V2_THEKT|nr:Vacuolar protein sorting/targeting protein 10 [Thelohanellus kitauei]